MGHQNISGSDKLFSGILGVLSAIPEQLEPVQKLARKTRCSSEMGAESVTRSRSLERMNEAVVPQKRSVLVRLMYHGNIRGFPCDGKILATSSRR